MPLALADPFRLAGSRGDGRHAYVNRDGAFIGRGVPLLERDPLGNWRPRPAAVLDRLLTAGYGTPGALGERAALLRQTAEALNEDNLALAGIALLRLRLPPLPSAAAACAMAEADGIVVKYNPDWPDEPRVSPGQPGAGEWTGEDDAGGAANDAGDDDAEAEPAADRIDPTQARKERFVDAHLADAQQGTARLRVPVENILGVSAVESGWGESRFATEGNNYFGIHYPAPYATGYLTAQRSTARVATFANYADSLRSFEAVAGRFVSGIRDPGDFATALQNRAKFGVGNSTYAIDMARTIRSLTSLLGRRGI